jgi:hypothetical protein
MWTRKSVKQRGKKVFYLNYWKCVLVALILCFVIGATGGSSSGGSYSIPALTQQITSSDSDSDIDTDIDSDTDFDLQVDLDGDGVNDIDSTVDKDQAEEFAVGAFIAAFVVGLIISVIIGAFALAFKYLLLTPFEYGCRKFFRKNLDEPAKLSNIVYVFDSHYKNVVKTAFLRDLFIWLWSLLFVIPGIIKSYEYRLVPYIVSENPNINYKDALAESKKLMQGNKWKSFVLDLSFIGWDILSLMTWGFLDIFFVGPYKASTDAALYETLKYGIDAK